MAYLTKGELWDLLGDEALNLSAFLLTPEGAAIKLMLENTDGIILESPLVQGRLLPMLVSAGVITQAIVDRVNAEIAKQNPPKSKYDMSYVDGNIIEWIEKNRIPSDATYTLSGEIVTLTGELPSPARRIS